MEPVILDFAIYIRDFFLNIRGRKFHDYSRIYLIIVKLHSVMYEFTSLKLTVSKTTRIFESTPRKTEFAMPDEVPAEQKVMADFMLGM